MQNTFLNGVHLVNYKTPGSVYYEIDAWTTLHLSSLRRVAEIKVAIDRTALWQFYIRWKLRVRLEVAEQFATQCANQRETLVSRLRES